MGRRVLVVSASMGAGHDGASRELIRRLEAGGNEARMVDFLDAAPLGLGTVMRVTYEFQLRRAPWAYEATYRMWSVLPALCRPLVTVVSLLTRRRLRRWISDWSPDVIVTTYPLGSVVLGTERQRGRIKIPVVTFVTDFAVHPLWVHPGVDLNLCVHEQSAEVAARRTGKPSFARGPLISDRFRSALPARDEARRSLGLGDDERAALVVAGAWGIGDITETFDAILATGRYTPVAVCGNNASLARKLASRNQGRVLGWTDEMPKLMAACDVLVQNAGGLTCMEAFAVGLPVVTFRPIPGHGRENAADMERAGVAPIAATDEDLAPALDRATSLAGRKMVAAGKAMFCGDPADEIIALADAAAERLSAKSGSRAERRPLRRRLGNVAVALAAVYATFTVGVGAATAHGIGVAHGQAREGTVYLAVRLGPNSLADPSLAAWLSRAGVTAVVSGRLAAEQPAAVQRLSNARVDLANGGWGRRNGVHWGRARADLQHSSRAIRSASGVPCREFVPVRRIDGFDLASARFAHERVIVASAKLSPGQTPGQIHAGQVLVLDAGTSDGPAVQKSISALEQLASEEHLAVASLAHLR